jgi:DNA polymerase-1
LEPLNNYIKIDGKVHPRFLQAGAATGRFSCEEPNMQNLPRNSELGLAVRKCFISGTDNIFISADYSQIDLRSAAILSHDEKLLEIFKNGTDIHRGVAAQVLNKNIDGVTDDERRKAKAINFGILYGMGVNALKDSMGTDRKTAQDFYDNFKNTFSTLMTYLEKVKYNTYKNGYTETLFGRRRSVPMIQSKLPFLRAQGERIAINAPIQGTSADIIKLGMIQANIALQDEIKSGNINMLLQIHDELVFECREKDKEKYAKIITESMQNVLQNKENQKLIKADLLENIDTPIIVNIAFGKSLFEL